MLLINLDKIGIKKNRFSVWRPNFIVWRDQMFPFSRQLDPEPEQKSQFRALIVVISISVLPFFINISQTM